MKGPGEPTFWEDLRSSISTWARVPWLPVISLAFYLVPSLLPEPLWPAAFATSILYAGWLGTERICFLRVTRGHRIEANDLLRLTLAFVMRYAVLGLIVSLLFIPVFAWLASRSVDGQSFVSGTAFLIMSYVVTTVIDVSLTFVTPALAFTTRRVRYALWLGIRMIRSEWPRCLWYVLVPPLAVLVSVQLLGRTGDLELGVQLGSSILFTLLNLWFKGATATFYLRRHDPYDERNGAAFLPRSPMATDPS